MSIGIEDPTGTEPLVVSPKRGCQMLDCSMTRFYELLNSGQIESYHEGKSRKAVVASIKAHISRQLEQEASKEPTRWTARATSVRMSKKNASRSSRRGA